MHHTKEMPAQPRRRAGLRWVSLVLSMVVLAVLLVVLWGQDQKNVLATTDETIDFLKERVVRYDNYVTNDKTKSLIRLLDKTAELSRCLGLSGAADQDIFDDYVYNQRLTGAVVVDETLRPIQQSSADGDTYTYWYDMLHSQNVTSIITYPAKSYMTRVSGTGKAMTWPWSPARGRRGWFWPIISAMRSSPAAGRSPWTHSLPVTTSRWTGSSWSPMGRRSLPATNRI